MAWRMAIAQSWGEAASQVNSLQTYSPLQKQIPRTFERTVISENVDSSRSRRRNTTKLLGHHRGESEIGTLLVVVLGKELILEPRK